MNLGSNLLLPTLVTMCRGKFTVDIRTRSPSLNERTFALPFLSAFFFCQSTASAMESCMKRTTVSRASMNSTADSMSFGCSALGAHCGKISDMGSKSTLALTFLFFTEVDVIDIGVIRSDLVIST